MTLAKYTKKHLESVQINLWMTVKIVREGGAVWSQAGRGWLAAQGRRELPLASIPPPPPPPFCLLKQAGLPVPGSYPGAGGGGSCLSSLFSSSLRNHQSLNTNLLRMVLAYVKENSKCFFALHGAFEFIDAAMRATQLPRCPLGLSPCLSEISISFS